VVAEAAGRTEPPVAASGQSACVNRDCIGVSFRLLSNMNTSVDPCEDFYQVSTSGCVYLGTWVQMYIKGSKLL
jgi:hypothetical protein